MTMRCNYFLSRRVLAVIIFTAGFCLCGISALAADPVLAHRLNQEAVDLAQTGDYQQAYRKITKAWEADAGGEVIRDNRIEIGRSLASEYMEQGRHQEAIDLLEDLRRLGGPRGESVEKQLAVALNNYAVAFFKKGDYITAENYFTRASGMAYQTGADSLYQQINEVFSQLLTAWAERWWSEGKGESAKVKLLEAIRRDSRNAVACRLLGRIYFEDGDYRQAEEYLDRALKIEPDNPGALAQLQRVRQESEMDRDFTQRRHGKFRVESSGREYSELTREALDVLNDARKKLGRKFDFYPPESLLVKIYDEQHSKKLNYGPHWAAGLYDGKIRVRADDLRRGGASLRDVLYHEYTHAVLFYMTRHNIPTWLNEGLAQVMEPDSRLGARQEDLVRDAFRAGNYVPFARMPREFVNFDVNTAQVLYLQSALFTEFLIDRYEMIRMRKLLRLLGEGVDIQEAISRSYTLSLDTLEQRWLQDLGV